MQGVKKTTDAERLQVSYDQVAAIVDEGSDQASVDAQPCTADGFGTSLYMRTVRELRLSVLARDSSVGCPELGCHLTKTHVSRSVSESAISS